MKENGTNRGKVYIVIIAGLLLIGICIRVFINNNENASIDTESTQTEERSETKTEEKNLDESKDIDEQELIKDNRLTIKLHEKIKEKIDEEKLKSSLTSYLEENQLYTEDTTLTSEEMLIEYLEKGSFQFTLLLNNSTGIYITVDVDKDGNFTFSSR